MTYTTNRWSSEDAAAWSQKICSQAGVALEFRRPGSFSNWSMAKSAVQSGRGSIQILMSLITSKSMVAVLLPPGWSSADPSGTYPILINGGYDIASNTSSFGALVARQQAALWKANKKSFIGVIWNGSGDIASRTMNEGMFQEINLILQQVAQNFGGDPQRVMTVGGSRGGVTSLRIAANPLKLPYKVRLAYAAVPPSDVNLIGDLTSATIPALLTAPDWSTGFNDCLTANWKYPNVGNDLAGLSCRDAHVKILTGTTNRATIDSQINLTSGRLLTALKDSGSQIYLEVGSHDFIVPWLDQFLLARRLTDYDIPHELRVNYMAGHWSDEARIESLIQNTMSKMDDFNYQNLVSLGRKNYFKVNSNGTISEINGPRFTIEFPRALIPRISGDIIATGIPGTKIKFSGTVNGSGSFEVTGELNSQGYWRTDLSGIDPAEYKVTSLQIQKPGESFKSISMNSRTNKFDVGTILVLKLADDVAGSGGALASKLMESILGAGNTQANGSFTNVSYGVLED